MNTITENEVKKLVEAVQGSRKYRELELPEEMLRDLITVNLPNSRNMAELKTNFRTSLHNVIAPYLEDTDYNSEIRALQSEDSSIQHPENLKSYCLKMMAKHASTKERIPHLDAFFDTIFEVIGSPNSILDLACALVPLCCPWLNLALGATFKASAINGAGTCNLQHFFT